MQGLRWCIALLCLVAAAPAQTPAFRVLACYSTHQEDDHVAFAQQAIKFFTALSKKDNFDLDISTDWSGFGPQQLARYQLVLWLDDAPAAPQLRHTFEAYMEHGGGWIGFHAAGYNDASTGWPWFEHFLGARFYGNSWPPLPATVDVVEARDAVTGGLPMSFLSPDNEWYSWTPDPEAAGHVKVLLRLAQSNFPLGFKDTLTGGDIPVLWTNTKYRMVYMNMGHGDKIFTSAVQNRLFEQVLLSTAKQGVQGR